MELAHACCAQGACSVDQYCVLVTEPGRCRAEAARGLRGLSMACVSKVESYGETIGEYFSKDFISGFIILSLVLCSKLQKKLACVFPRVRWCPSFSFLPD